MRHALPCSEHGRGLFTDGLPCALAERPSGTLNHHSLVWTAGVHAADSGLEVFAGPPAAEAAKKGRQPEELLRDLHHALTHEQRSKVCLN